MPIITCDICQKEFSRKPSHIRVNNFCSKSCLEEWRGSRTEVDCDYCGKKIIKVASELRDHNFCDMSCSGRWKSENICGDAHHRSYLSIVPCEFCGDTFKPYLSSMRFCSVDCANRSKENQIELECFECGSMYSISVSEHKWAKDRGYLHNFCGKKCQHNFQRKEGHPAWIKDRSLVKNKDKTLRNTEEMKEWRRSVFSRDNWQCQQCGDRSCKGHRVILNAHHIKRVVDCPELSTDICNGITLCESCHKKTYKKEHVFEKQFLQIIESYSHSPETAQSSSQK